MKLITSVLVGLAFSLPVFANPSSNSASVGWPASRFSIGAYGGYGSVSGAYKQDGQFAQDRLALAMRAGDFWALAFGIETGVQSGNTMRLSASSSLINDAGGLPIQSTLKPVLDLLITVRGQILPEAPLSVILKGGVAYRQLVLDDRSSTRDGLRQVSGEFQAGLAYNLTCNTALTAFYQGIYSGANAGLALNSAGDVTIGRIPTQQAGFLGLEYSI